MVMEPLNQSLHGLSWTSRGESLTRNACFACWYNTIYGMRLYCQKTQQHFLKWPPTVFGIRQDDFESHAETIPVSTSTCNDGISNTNAKFKSHCMFSCETLRWRKIISLSSHFEALLLFSMVQNLEHRQLNMCT